MKKIINVILSYTSLIYNYFKKFYYKKYIFNFFRNLKTFQQKPLKGIVLIDGLWENPNYWIRLNLILRALNLYSVKKFGLLGEYSRNSIKQSFNSFKINNLIDITKINIDENSVNLMANRLITNSVSSSDILKWRLPYNFPPELLYDSLLSKLKTPSINLKDPRLIKFTIKLLTEIEVAFKIFEKFKFSLFLCSHSMGSTYGSLVWAAIKNNVKVICLYGDYGTLRFIKYDNLFQLRKHILQVPSQKQFNNISPKKQSEYIKKGAKYINDRLNKKTSDIGAKLAIHKKRDEIGRNTILEYFKSYDKKIITVYTHHWSDFPHSLGLKNFTDFKEWFDITLNEAVKNKKFLWLFKGHPISEKYHYSSTKLIQKYLSKKENIDHIKIVPETWDWKTILDSTDYVITCVGSIGFEASAMNKFVLLSDPGWYGILGFGKLSISKRDYIKNLQSNWWESINLNTSKSNASKFIGIHYCNPEWLTEYYFMDDNEQNKIYNNLKSFLNKNSQNFQKEISCLQSWLTSKEQNYHIYKNLEYNYKQNN